MHCRGGLRDHVGPTPTVGEPSPSGRSHAGRGQVTVVHLRSSRASPQPTPVTRTPRRPSGRKGRGVPGQSAGQRNGPHPERHAQTCASGESAPRGEAGHPGGRGSPKRESVAPDPASGCPRRGAQVRGSAAQESRLPGVHERGAGPRMREAKRGRGEGARSRGAAPVAKGAEGGEERT